MTELQKQVSDRVNAFVEEITTLARKSAYESLSVALDYEGGRIGTGAWLGGRMRRPGAKRTADELASMARAFLEFVRDNPGERMETIARQLGYTTQQLTLPVKKLNNAGKLQVEGQKRATSYYIAEGAFDDDEMFVDDDAFEAEEEYEEEYAEEYEEEVEAEEEEEEEIEEEEVEEEPPPRARRGRGKGRSRARGGKKKAQSKRRKRS